MRHHALRIAVGLILFGGLLVAPAAQAQVEDEPPGEGGDDTGGDASGDAGVDASGGWATSDSFPVAATDRPLAFGAPPSGVIRFSPQWENDVFTESQSFGFASLTFTSWASLFSLQVDLGDLVVRGLVPLGYLRSSSSPTMGPSMSSDQAELGNLELEGLANIDLGSPEMRLLIGGGLALPTATDQPCETASCGGNGAIVRGIAWGASFRNPQAWANQSFTVWPSVEYRLGVPWFLFSAIGSIPIFIPTNSQVGGPLSRGNVEMMMQLDVSGAVRILNVVDVGVGLLAWAMPSGAGYSRGGMNPDLGQTALSFFVRTDPELDAPITGGAEFILDLDNSWGPTGDNGKFWGLRLFIGGRFDV